MGKSERDRQVIEKSERQASDGEGRETDRGMMGKSSKRQANDGEERERQASVREEQDTGKW